jgi:hypothetical protein
MAQSLECNDDERIEKRPDRCVGTLPPKTALYMQVKLLRRALAEKSAIYISSDFAQTFQF